MITTREIQDVLLDESLDDLATQAYDLIVQLDKRLDGLRKKALKAKSEDTVHDLRAALNEIADELWEVIS